MNILIIEDEYYTAKKLRDLVLAYDDSYCVLDCLGSVEDAINWLKTHKSPDLIFQDIELSDGNCFDIYEQVQVNTPLIFTTAYSEYILKSFRFNSIDYILKPYNIEDITRVLDKFHEFSSIFSTPAKEIFQQLIPNINKPVKKRFLIRIGETFKSIRSDEVALLFSEQSVTMLHTYDKKRYPIDSTLNILEQQLDTHTFFRINRGCIVSSNAIGDIQNWFSGRIKIALKPFLEEAQIVSRDRVKDFKKWLDT